MTSSSSKHPTPPPARSLQITTTTAAAANDSASSYSSAVTHHHHPSSSSIRSPRVAGGGPNQACAACKYQRRKCNPDCPLARYFPADQQRRFLNAHRLFGVGNIQRTLRETPPDLRNDAMAALIYEADARAYDPVGGCYHMVFNLERQFHLLRAERRAVYTLLDDCRKHKAHDTLDDDGSGMMMLVGAGPSSSYGVPVDALYATGGQEIDYGHPSGDHYLLGAADQLVAQQHPHQQYDYFYYDGPAGDETSSHAWSNADHKVQQYYGNGVFKAESPVASLGDDQIETQFDVFDVKPEIAVATAVVMEHDAGSDDSFEHPLERKVMETVVKNEQLDHQAAAQMAVESSTAVSRCQLELGFSSF